MTLAASENISDTDFSLSITPIKPNADMDLLKIEKELSDLIDRNEDLILVVKNLQQGITNDNHCMQCGKALSKYHAFCNSVCAQKYMSTRSGVVRMNNGKFIFGRK